MESTKRKVNPIRRIISLLLIFACIFALVAAGTGVKDVLAIQAELTGSSGSSDDGESADGSEESGDSEESSDPLAPLKDGLDQLAENEDVYFEGVETYNDGLVQLADGAKQLADGEKQLAEGYQAYADGQKQLADGQKQIDDNTDAYNEGKATIEQIEPILPYLEKYVDFRDGTIANIPGFETAQEYFMKVVRPLAAEAGLEIPEDANDLPNYILDMVADGKVQLKTYEDGLVQLEEGKKQLADGKQQLIDGENQLAEGRQAYADGQQQLADGDKQLKQFEDGEKQIVSDGYDTVFALQSYTAKDGTTTVKSPKEVLGEDFDYYKYDEDGNKVLLRDGTQALDLDKGYQIYEVAEQYVQDLTNAATEELYGRVYAYIALAIAAILGIITGFLGLFGKSVVMTIISACASLVPLVLALVKGMTNYTFTLADGSGAPTLQFAAIVTLAAVAVCNCIVAIIFKPSKEELAAEKEAKKAKKAAKKAEKEAAKADAE